MHRQLHTKNAVEEPSHQDAERYLRKMYSRIVSGWGGCTRAVEDIAKRCGMTVSQVKHILDGRTVSVSMSHYGKIRTAYLAFIQEERAMLDAEIKAEDEKTQRMEPVFFHEEIDTLKARLQALRSITRKGSEHDSNR